MSGEAGILFQDSFDVTGLNPEGRKYDKGVYGCIEANCGVVSVPGPVQAAVCLCKAS